MKNQFNRATHALRQPGSAFKPFVYAAAIEKGMTSQEKIDDSPIFLKGSKPGNYGLQKIMTAIIMEALHLRLLLPSL